ncbi:ATP-binding protein [Pelagicoccus sp. SDUM812003]|uniref:sensor histidine kinase n=1 Tax=Pelagicoccus sp. SDUM812003 TaxID=3041267 RepID=UPI0028107705|nr:ATP-binding protein [Pelagicoccus sp. SDUM812003]MDQ8204102.1 ATP-binding protein [Pelagicoccus sp. SDUM812003]
MPHRSIRFRIQFWHSLLLVVITIGLSLSYYYYEKQNQLRLIDVTLQSVSVRLLPQVETFILRENRERFPPRRPPGDAGMASRPAPRPRLDRRPGIQTSAQEIAEELSDLNTMVYAWDRDLEQIYQSPNATELSPELGSFSAAPDRPNLYTVDRIRLFVTKTRIGMTIGFAKDISEHIADLAALRKKLVALDALIIFAGVFGGWYLTGRAIRPIQTISDTAKKIADGQRNLRISSSDTGCELESLAKVLNETFYKLDRSYAQQVQFTADASHELRTPVAALLTQIQLALSRERRQEEYIEHFQACQNQANHLKNLLSSLLDLARSDSGELEFRKADYDLSELVQECCDWLEPIAAKKEVSFTKRLAPVTARIDGLRMGQVLTNILSNAIRYSPNGETIRIELQQIEERARIRISDNGPGIPASERSRIFDRFVRASKSRSSASGNVGLGLAIAKAIVEQHKGSIQVESSQPGATFIVEFPLS